MHLIRDWAQACFRVNVSALNKGLGSGFQIKTSFFMISIFHCILHNFEEN